MDSALNVLLAPGGAPREAASMFAAALATLFASKIIEFTLDDQAKDEISAAHDDANNATHQFDFIVVGAGSAGGTLASRLSENYSVLLLEAGGEIHPLHNIPMFASPLASMPMADWGFHTVPQRNSCILANNQQMKLARGKGLGGSSNLNFMIYSRGHPEDYNNWANITGDSRWGYENVLKYFKKSEDFTVGDPNFDVARYHSHGGPLKVTEHTFDGMIEHYIAAAKQLGIPHTDLNAEYVEGIAPLYFTQNAGKRWGVAKAFIAPARKRQALKIYKFAHASRVLFQENSSTAIGVEFVRHGVTRQAFASKEVIISAGALKSPQVLMLSGLGPRDQLEKFGIPVLKDLPGVGKNLQDHYGASITPIFLDPPESIKQLTPLGSFLDYMANNSGPLTSPGPEANVLLVSDHTRTIRGQPDWPDLQIFLCGALDTLLNTGAVQLYNLKEDVVEEFLGKYEGQLRVSLQNMIVRPYSRGTVTLQSADPEVPMLFDPNYFGDDRDMEILVDGAKRAMKLIDETDTFQKLNARLANESMYGCTQHALKSDAYWECFHRETTITVWHQTSTCAMGPQSDPDAVVDSNLRVYGARNLRVVDASVMPVIPAGNTNAPTIMIAEMAADFIKEAWQ